MGFSKGGALVVNAAGTIGSDTVGVYLLKAALTYADGAETVPTSGYVTVVIEAKLS